MTYNLVMRPSKFLVVRGFTLMMQILGILEVASFMAQVRDGYCLLVLMNRISYLKPLTACIICVCRLVLAWHLLLYTLYTLPLRLCVAAGAVSLVYDRGMIGSLSWPW